MRGRVWAIDESGAAENTAVRNEGSLLGVCVGHARMMGMRECNDYVQATYSNGAGSRGDARHAGVFLYRLVRAVRVVLAERHDPYGMRHQR